MSANDLNNVTKELAEQKVRISTLEGIADKFDKVADQLHELCISINSLTNKYDSHATEFERSRKRLDKIESNHSALKEEVIENRPLVKAVKALGLKIMWFSLTVVGAATVIVISMKW